jgi:hypothetical protein
MAGRSVLAGRRDYPVQRRVMGAEVVQRLGPARFKEVMQNARKRKWRRAAPFR